MNADATQTITIEFSDTQAHLRVDRVALAGLARLVLRREGIVRASLSIALVDDATIHQINRRHLAHDWPTDVITFVLAGPDEPEPAVEVVLSTEMAAETARRAGTDPGAELALYLVHGLLHFCGHDDQNEADSQVMRRREAEALASFGLPHLFASVGPPGNGVSEVAS